MRELSKNSSKQSHRLARKWTAYAAAAATISSGVADAAIIHTDLGTQPISAVNGSFELDVDLDGTADFEFLQRRVQSSHSDSSPCRSTWRRDRRESLVSGRGQNGMIGNLGSAYRLTSRGYIYPFAIGIQNAILAVHGFRSSSNCRSTSSDNYVHGHFGSYYDSLLRGFLGLQFEIAGNGRHAGWADVEVSADQIVLHGFAYETTPGKALRAGAVPEPHTLALLAMGAAGMIARRRQLRRNS